MARRGLSRRRRCTSRCRTRHRGAALVADTGDRVPRPRPLSASDGCVWSVGDWSGTWSCRESNPGPAVPMLWALRAQIADHLGCGAPRSGSFRIHTVSGVPAAPDGRGQRVEPCDVDPVPLQGVRGGSSQVFRLREPAHRWRVWFSARFVEVTLSTLGTLPRQRTDHGRDHVSPVSFVRRRIDAVRLSRTPRSVERHRWVRCSRRCRVGHRTARGRRCARGRPWTRDERPVSVAVASGAGPDPRLERRSVSGCAA
jgi:hypothetical protein